MEDFSLETPLFQNRHVTVTATKMTVGKKAYLLKDFSSASVADGRVMWVVAIPFIIISLISAVGGQNMMLAGFVFAAGLLLPFNPLIRPKCVLLNSSVLLGDGKVVKAYSHRNVEEMEKIANAVNLAINSRNASDR